MPVTNRNTTSLWQRRSIPRDAYTPFENAHNNNPTIISGSNARRPVPPSRYFASNADKSNNDTASTTNRTAWSSGTHSSMLGGIRNR